MIMKVRTQNYPQKKLSIEVTTDRAVKSRIFGGLTSTAAVRSFISFVQIVWNGGSYPYPIRRNLKSQIQW